MMARVSRRALLALALCGAFDAPGIGPAPVRGENLQGCIDDFDPETDYFPHKAILEVAELFSIEYHNYYKIVRNTEDDKTYVLVQCGAPAPSAEELSAINVTEVDFTIDVPLTNVALQYSTMEAFFGMLGERRKVQAILGTSYSTESCMMELVDDGLIVELDDALASANASYVNEQGLVATNPNLEKEFSVDNLVGFVGRTGWNAKEYPFPFVRSSGTMEPTREGLFEKVKFYSAFLNKEERANYLWGQVQTRLDCVQANAAAVEPVKGEKTKILWAGYSGYCKGWNVARTGPFFYHDFAKVCSAELLHAEMGGDLVSEVEACQSPERRYMSPEDFFEFGKDADVWLWNGPSPPPLDDANIFTEEVKAFKAFQNQELYFPGGSTGWYDQANMQPDVLTEDICSIAGTLDLEDGSEYQRKWYSNAFTLDVNTPNPTCEELGGIDAPRETQGSNCAFRTTTGEATTTEATADPSESKANEATTSATEATTTSATEATAPETETAETETTADPPKDTETSEFVSSNEDSSAPSTVAGTMASVVTCLALVNTWLI